MLKLNYTQDGLYMEPVAAPLEVMIAQRVMLALRMAQTLYMEPGRASFLITHEVPGLAQLVVEVQAEQGVDVTLTPVDEDFVEISLHGTWIAQNSHAEEGLFIAALPPRLEYFVYKLWQLAQGETISLR